jgi:hypothetical protein
MEKRTYPNIGAIWNRENPQTGSRSFWGVMKIDGKDVQFVARLNQRKIDEQDIEKKRKLPDFLIYPYEPSKKASTVSTKQSNTPVSKKVTPKKVSAKLPKVPSKDVPDVVDINTKDEEMPL